MNISQTYRQKKNFKEELEFHLKRSKMNQVLYPDQKEFRRKILQNHLDTVDKLKKKNCIEEKNIETANCYLLIGIKYAELEDLSEAYKYIGKSMIICKLLNSENKENLEYVAAEAESCEYFAFLCLKLGLIEKHDQHMQHAINLKVKLSNFNRPSFCA